MPIDPINGIVLTEIVLGKRTTPEAVSEFIKHTYSASRGMIQNEDLIPRFVFLEKGKLIYKEDGSERT